LLAVSVAGKDGQAVLAAQTGTRSFAFTTPVSRARPGREAAGRRTARRRGAISALLVHSNGERILLGTSQGRLLDYA